MSDRPSARERLLRATSELTYERGIEATGVDAIAERAAVTKRTLYQHFGSKAELVGAALASVDAATMSSLRAAVERRRSKGERPIAALFSVIARTFGQSAYRGCAFLNAGVEMHDADHPVRAAVRSHTDARHELVAELVAAEGVSDPDTVEAVALLVEGAFVLSASRREPAVAQRAASAAESVIDAALERQRS